MRGFIESGAAWMRPINEFRDWLKAIREETSMRDGIRRNDSIGPGPFNSEARKTILRRLLELEKTVGRRLIEDAEISYIQQQWTDKFDVTDSALAIAREFGSEVGALKITHEDSFSDLALIEELAPRFDVQSIWATDLYHLVTERYPSLDSPRSHQQLLDG
jgi:DNA sulfur modification protein DndC